MENTHGSPGTLKPRTSRLHVRASQLLKQVTTLGGRTSGWKVWKQRTSPYAHECSANGHQPKPYMSQPALPLEMPGPEPTNTTSSDGSSRSTSPTHPPSKRRERSMSEAPWDGMPASSPDAALAARMSSDFNATAIALVTINTLHAGGECSLSSGTPEIVVSTPLTASTTPEQQPSVPPPITSPISSGPFQNEDENTPGLPSSHAQPNSAVPEAASSPQAGPPRLDLPPPSPQFHARAPAAGARLSPSIIYRHPPMPLNLPPLPQTPTPGPSSLQRMPSRGRLRAMPALPMEGADDDDNETDHEDDDDDGDDGVHGDGSDEDEDETRPISQESERPPPSNVEPGLPRLVVPAIDTSLHLDVSGPSTMRDASTPRVDAGPLQQDYFTAKMTGYDAPTSVAGARLSGSWAKPPPHAPPRIGLYRHTSKSMVHVGASIAPDLHTPSATIHEETTITVGKGKGKAREELAAPDYEPAQVQRAGYPSGSEKTPPALQRRRSMPTFNSTGDPPPYPAFARHPHCKFNVIQPRDEEGKEGLPPYTNQIFLTAIMPRKMEFSAPGVQAKDRKWRRVLCVLEGTSFKVYKCPSGASGVGLIGEWWEKQVGVGDVSTQVTAPSEPGKREVAAPPPKLRTEPESSTPEVAQLTLPDRRQRGPPSCSGQSSSRSPSRSPTPIASMSSRSRLHLTVGLLKPSSSRSHSRSRSDVPKECSSPQARHRQTGSDGLRPSHFMPPLSTTEVQEVPAPDPADLLRAYTLQHAESGLGNDYLKRKNVIRVRMEGEQFLLQARDIAAVIEWIEGFQAAANIALDLDERPMPKPPMFPRRRRRRPRRPDGTTTDATRPEPR